MCTRSHSYNSICSEWCMPTTTSHGHGQANTSSSAHIRLNRNGLERGLTAQQTTREWPRLANGLLDLHLFSAEIQSTDHWLKWSMRAACLRTIATSAMPEKAYPECLASLCMLKTVKKRLAVSISWQSCFVMGRFGLCMGFLVCAMKQSAWVLANFHPSLSCLRKWLFWLSGNSWTTVLWADSQPSVCLKTLFTFLPHHTP